MLFPQLLRTTWNLLPQATWKTYISWKKWTKTNEQIQIDSSEITKSRLMCFDWLFWWNICGLSCERGILRFLGNFWDEGHTSENCTQSWQLHYKWRYILFYVIGSQNVNISKIFPLTDTIFYFHGNNTNIIQIINIQFPVDTNHTHYS